MMINLSGYQIQMYLLLIEFKYYQPFLSVKGTDANKINK